MSTQFFIFPFPLIMPLALIFFGLFFVRRIFSRFFRRLDEPDPDELVSRQYRAIAGKDIIKKEDTEVKIFKLAKRLKGKITLSDIVLETGLGLNEAEKYINSLVDGIHIKMEVKENGLVMYEFPEIIARNENDFTV